MLAVVLIGGLLACIVGIVMSVSKAQARRDEEERDLALRNAAFGRERAAREALEAYRTTLREVWVLNECRYKDAPALFALKRDSTVFAIFPYTLSQGCVAATPIEIPTATILSVELRRDDVKERYERTELVPTEITNKKSPVGRAVVGGLLLGPTGAVVGAASGLGGKAKVTVEERKVADERIVKGPPKLIIGAQVAGGVFSLEFAVQDHADHWRNQVRSARATLGLPPVG